MRHVNSFVVLVAAISFCGPAFGAGTVEEAAFYSQALGMEQPVQVYLPEGYATSNLAYPVLYLLTESIGPDALTMVAFHLDRMIAAGQIDPMIVVAVNGVCAPFASWGFPAPMPTLWQNSELSGQWQDALVSDLVTWVDEVSGYRTLADPAHRFIAGHFLGGGSAMLTALDSPEVFAAVVASNGNGTFEVYEWMLPIMLATEYPDGPPYTYRPDAGPISFQNFMLAAAFTPDTTSSPWPIDLWLDADGNVVPEVWQRLVEQTSPALASALAASGAELDIYFDCENPGSTLPACQRLHTALDTLGIHHVTSIYSEQTFFDRVPIYLSFFTPLNASMDIRPRVFSLRSLSPWVTAHLELPTGLSVSDIELDSLALTAVNGENLTTPIPCEGVGNVGDTNGNGTPDLRVRFSRSDLIDAVMASNPSCWRVNITVRGVLSNELFFEATDSVRMLWPRTD